MGEDTSANFLDTPTVLDDYFIPKANVPFERLLFWQIAQEVSETGDLFVCRLRQRAVSCDFGDREDDYIRDHVIDKCYLNHMRRKFLEKEGTSTLEDLLTIASSQETVDRQMNVMVSNAGADQVNVLRVGISAQIGLLLIRKSSYTSLCNKSIQKFPRIT